MKYALTAAQMKACDRHTIEHFGVASLILQERAALAVADKTCQLVPPSPRSLILIYAGSGNNGADALAAARLLAQRNFSVRVCLVETGTPTKEHEVQLQILSRYGIRTDVFSDLSSGEEIPALVIDGILGVGLTRELSGTVRDAVTEMESLQKKGALVLALDIATGISADDGRVMGCAVRADHTVTFGFVKCGQLLYPGASYSGQLSVADIGITAESLMRGTPQEVIPAACYLESVRETGLPARPANGHKGTFGKVLVIAGSKEVCGAAILCATAVMRAGCGMVRVLTHIANRGPLSLSLPEALISVYGEEEEPSDPIMEEALSWADTVVIGPGIGTERHAKKMLHDVLSRAALPLVADADALNLLAADESLLELASLYREKGHSFVLTPHVAEFARLYTAAFHDKVSAAGCAAHLLSYPVELAQKMHATVLLKDARSVIADEQAPQPCINLSGNAGMATAGSGDVLAGLIGALLAQGMDGYGAACAGACLHGFAGDRARETVGEAQMLASDISSRLEAARALFADTGREEP